MWETGYIESRDGRNEDRDWETLSQKQKETGRNVKNQEPEGTETRVGRGRQE